MNRTKQNFILCFTFLLIVGFACKRSTSSQSNQNAETPNTANINGDTGKDQKPKRDPNEKVFRGSIYVNSGPSSFVMKLKREGNQLTGSYYYLKTHKDISLKGSIDGQGKFTMQETSEGNVTGTFTGDWKDSETEPVVYLEGQWKKAGSTDEWAFNATEQTVETTGDQTIEDKTIKEENKQKKLSVSVFYPQISGFGAQTDAINKDIASTINRGVADFKKELDCTGVGEDISCSYEVDYNTMIAKDDFLSFVFGIYTYSGGAHPNTNTVTLAYDVKSGNRLKLRDLFKPNSNYLKTISDYSIEALKKHLKEIGGDDPDEEMLKEGAGAKEDNYVSWGVSKKGLIIYFDPYQVAAYALGPQMVVVPYSVLKDKVKEDGALSPFIK